MASRVFLALAHKPTEFIVQVFAQAVTVSKTAWEADCLTCMESQGRRFTGKLSNIMFYFKVILKYIVFTQRFRSLNVKFVLMVAQEESSKIVKKCKGLIL